PAPRLGSSTTLALRRSLRSVAPTELVVGRVFRPGRLFEGFDGNDTTTRTMVAEFHDTVHFCEKRIILAAPDVEARAEPQPGAAPIAARAEGDRPAGDDVAVETLHAEALRVAVAAVA